MARAVYSYELEDPDFVWLINSFRETHPGYCLCDSPMLPVVLIRSIEAEEKQNLLLPPSAVSHEGPDAKDVIGE